MANRIDQDAKATRPLWVIAISLLTIAVCLVLLVVKKHFSDSEEGVAPVTVAVKEADKEPTYSPKRQSARVRPVPSSQTLAELSETLVIAESSEAQSLLSSEHHTPRSPAGGVAASALLQSTNYTTAIVGRITLRGKAPPEMPINLDAPCADLLTNASTTRNFVVSQDGGLADVFVAIVAGLERKLYKPPPTNHEIVFVRCQIQPYVSASMRGQRLTLRNADPRKHTFQLHKINKSPFLSYPLSPNSRVNLPTDTSEMSRWPGDFLGIKCEEHSWETAYLSLFHHPFFAVTDTNGNYVIPNVPPGDYTVRVAHISAGVVTNKAMVRPGKISQVHFTLDAPAD